MKDLTLERNIESKIYLIRGQKVMIDHDLAELYDAPTKRLIEQVKRNIRRFPDDFMFQLTWNETKSLRSQNATLKRGEHVKYKSYAFTEQGVAMLSSILNSERAIQVNIQIMRTFTKLRKLLATHKDLQRKIEEMEKNYDQQFRIVFDAIKALIQSPQQKKKSIGFLREKRARYKV